MKIFLSQRERLAGGLLLLAFAAALVFVVASAVEQGWLERRMHFRTVLQRGDGLRKGLPVQLSGLEVGRVGAVAVRDDGRVEVELVVQGRYAQRLGEGSRVVVRRLAGIGEKRLLLQPASPPAPPLTEGALLVAEEPVDLLDALTAIDFGRHVQTVDRAMAAVELWLERVSEAERMERLLGTVDRLPAALAKLERLLDEVHGPLAGLLRDDSLRGALRGADALLNDPATPAAVQGLARALEKQRLDRLVARSEEVLVRLGGLLDEEGHLHGALAGADRLLGDERLERLLFSLDRLLAEEQTSRLLEDLALLARQGAEVGPEIPALARELLLTLREAVVVLKALQQSWPLADKARQAREELSRPTAPPLP